MLVIEHACELLDFDEVRFELILLGFLLFDCPIVHRLVSKEGLHAVCVKHSHLFNLELVQIEMFDSEKLTKFKIDRRTDPENRTTRLIFYHLDIQGILRDILMKLDLEVIIRDLVTISALKSKEY